MPDEDHSKKIKEHMKTMSISDIQTNPVNVHLYQLNSILKSIRYSISELLGDQDKKNKTFKNIEKLNKIIKEGDSNPFLSELEYWKAAKDLIKLQDMVVSLKDREVESAINIIGKIYFESLDKKDNIETKKQKKVDFKKIRDSDIPEDFKDDMLPED